MNKTSIKNYAIWARNELISRVSQKAFEYGVEKDNIVSSNANDINGRLLSNDEKKKRQILIKEVNRKGFDQVMEEVAYTWFNRFIALRFMEVNNYLPKKVRVFTNDNNEFKPQIMDEALHVDLMGLDKNKVITLKEENNDEELYKELLLATCNDMSQYLTGMFKRIDDYMTLLFPSNLLREESVLGRLISDIDEDSWNDQVQIIGWLYQYYNTEPKDKVFGNLKKNIKITKENIPAATQLFTPDWIVHYMVENSLGRLWLEGHPNDTLKSEWKYYLDEAEQESEVQAKLDEMRKEYANIQPEDIKVIDPCMGSGHILCVLFDVLMSIYADYGYSTRQAVSNIIEKNLWGLDIDERATQLAYFAVMMKARQYDRRFLSRGLKPHVYAIEESNGITTAPMHDMGINLTQNEYSEAVKQTLRLVEEMHDAKEYGSIIHVTPCDWNLLRQFAIPRDEDGHLQLNIHGEVEAAERLQYLINVGEALSQKYHIVVTNPPYMGSSGMGFVLSKYLKNNYTDSCSDMSTVFMERCISYSLNNGFVSMINIPVWMYLTGYESLRKKILDDVTIISLVHPGRGIFGSDFGTVAFVFNHFLINDYKGTYCKLFEKQGEVRSCSDRESIFLSKNNRYVVKQEQFKLVPGTPLTYWMSSKLISAFQVGRPLSPVCKPTQGLATGDNGRFLRLWFEVCYRNLKLNARSSKEGLRAGARWFPYNKGGEFRKWYGNNDYVVNWENDGYEIKHFYNEKGKLRSRPQNTQYYFRRSITWSKISAASIAFRYKPEGHIFDVAGTSIFCESDIIFYYTFGALNSNSMLAILNAISPTVNYEVGQIASLPIIYSEKDVNDVIGIVKRNVALSAKDWDSFETSWDFKRHSLLRGLDTIKESYELWNIECTDRFNQLKSNEEELNRIFIDIYDLQDELTPEVEDRDVTVRKSDLTREIKSLISYAVGCMFGRYSLDIDGLVYAGGEWDESKYKSFIPDKDNIIPIYDDEYLDDDIVGRFIEFIRVAYGEDTLKDNLQFIAEALGGKGNPKEVLRSYFINDFFKDHCNTYQVAGSGRRPIYWQFDSGKKNGFKALIYIHRYTPDLIARMRTSYIHDQQSRYDNEISTIQNQINSVTVTSKRTKLNKKLKTLKDQAEELRIYEEKVHHWADKMEPMNLDDGVKVNYAKFQELLTKIK